MQTNQLDSDLLRRLADLRPDGGRVLSLFLNLDPSQFGTAPSRTTEINSLLDDADRRVRDESDLGHDDQRALREDIERVRRFLAGADFEGAHGMAIYACGSADLFEAIKLPRPIDTRACISDHPFVEPLAELAMRGTWVVLLVNRQLARMLRGSRDGLTELPPIEDDVHRQHDQGGWSLARYQRSVDKEVQDHLRRAAEVVFRRFQRSPFERILLGGPEEILSDVEQRLHPYLRERIAGRVRVDVENTTPEAVREAAAAVMDEVERSDEREALERLDQGVGAGGRATAGVAETVAALNERRVETLLLVEGFDAAGAQCRSCGWLGVDPEAPSCPADGGELDGRDDISEAAVELAIQQSAKVLVVRDHRDDLEGRGGCAALLRF